MTQREQVLHQINNYLETMDNQELAIVKRFVTFIETTKAIQTAKVSAMMCEDKSDN